MPAKSPNRKTRRAAQSKRLQRKTRKVSTEVLEELQDAKEVADFAQAEAQKSVSDFNYLVATAMKREKAPITTSTLCLECGTIRPNVLPKCPTCPDPMAEAAQ